MKAPSSSFKTVHVLPGCFSLISECDGIELISGQLICLEFKLSYKSELLTLLLLRGTTVQVLQTCGYYNQLYENMISVLVATGAHRPLSCSNHRAETQQPATLPTFSAISTLLSTILFS